MRKLLLGLLITAAHVLSAAPNITGGPVNAASFALNGLPNAGIARGSLFVLFGAGIGPTTFTQASSFPLPAALANTSISVTVAGAATPCIMIHTVASQVAAILPSSVAVGDGTLTLTLNGQASNAVPIHVVANSIGIFARNQAGSGPAVVQNFNTQTDQPVNSILTSAKPGQVETLWTTGLGAVTGNEAAGPLPGNLTYPVQVFVGGLSATVTYAGRSGCCAGVDQIVFSVPSGITGCYVPVSVFVGGVMSNFTTMGISASGGLCSDPGLFNTADLNQIQSKINSNATVTAGSIELLRLNANLNLAGMALVGNHDEIEVKFKSYKPLDFLGAGSPANAKFSTGTCGVIQYTLKNTLDAILPGGGGQVPTTPLRAGAQINMSGPGGAISIPEYDPAQGGEYSMEIGGVGTSSPEYYSIGSYTINNGTGGSGVPGFNTVVGVNSGIGWLNPPAVNSTVSRSTSMQVTWNGATDSDLVIIVGSSANTTTNAGAAFYCVSPGGTNLFSIPGNILAALPPSGNSSSGPVGFLSVGRVPARSSGGSTLVISGIDYGTQSYVSVASRNVNFQ